MASWKLTPTIDRAGASEDSQSRDQRMGRLIAQFKLQSIGIPHHMAMPDEPIEWELLGRHHGLPTTILNWATSPYVAAFFAFEPELPSDEPVAIYSLDRNVFLRSETSLNESVEVLDAYEHLWFNTRAVEQTAVSVRIRSRMDLEKSLGDDLIKFTLPRSERVAALGRLQAMRITARSLYRDLDHAAATARWIVSVEESAA